MDVGEKIRPIKDYPGYFISDKGNVFSKRVRIENKISNKKFKKLKLKLINTGYYQVCIRDINGKTKWRFIASLVLESFVGERPDGFVACHGKNGKKDNSLENLSWKTPKENNYDDKIRDGTLKMGEKHSMSKLNERKVNLIKFLIKENFKCNFIAKIFNISASNISYIKSGKTWKHLL